MNSCEFVFFLRAEFFLYTVFSHTFLAPFIWRKVVRVEASPAHPSNPERANFTHISLQNMANRLHEKERLARL